MKRKKIWMIPPNILFICSMTSLVACNNKVTYSQLKENFNKQKEKFHSLIKIENKKFSSGDPVNNAINNYFSLLEKNDKTLENKKEINKKEYFTENKNESRLNNKDNELLQQLIKEEKQQKEELKKQKIITISLVISGSILAAIAAGLGIYFGTKDINSDENIKRKALENDFFIYKDLIKKSENSQSLFDVFNKIIDLTFEENIPKAILSLLKEMLLQDYLQDFNEENEKVLLEKLSKIQKPSKEILNKIFNELTNSKVFLQNNEKEIISKIKKLVVDIAKEYLPSALRSILDFLTLQSAFGNKSSILARIVIKILKKNNIIFENVENISEVLKIINSILINKQNTLLDFFINSAINTLEKNELSFDIESDFFNIFNKTIEEMFTDEDKKELSLKKIFDNIIPKIIELVQIDEKQSYVSFVKFINDSFTMKKNENKWVYLFLKFGNILDKSDNNFEKKLNKKYKIIFPKFNIISFDNIFLAFKNRSSIEKTIEGFIKLMFKPLIIELSKIENLDNTKKSIFRLVIFLSFIFYKYVKLKNKIFDKLLHIFNPYEPDTYLVKIIKNLLTDMKSSIQIENILGSKNSKWKFWDKKFDIFNITKKAAENNQGKLDELIKLLKIGYKE
ncbi:hypothetical protein [Mycoplasma phocimorsus]|uniref:hypothetical protein n=1 Tax=Mycoplasma phocimorsus TaxID=3045839 RepID=UPI0024C07F8F|nr:hypothetical protein [Mycoplasma phocimorsus]MDJ1647287.1 hypothetical protein [Mycoplasma phocimorsus]